MCIFTLMPCCTDLLLSPPILGRVFWHWEPSVRSCLHDFILYRLFQPQLLEMHIDFVELIGLMINQYWCTCSSHAALQLNMNAHDTNYQHIARDKVEAALSEMLAASLMCAIAHNSIVSPVTHCSLQCAV